jgi:AmiR/NasT family two-component response regulator
MTPSTKHRKEGLRILAADEDEAALESTAQLLRGLGHEVTSLAVSTTQAADRIAAEDPDLAVVVVDRDDEHALDLITEISSYSSGPVIALLDEPDREFIGRAAERGISAWARHDDPDSVQSAIEVALRRHAEREQLAEQVGQLEGALDRRALIERAKGILMERHGVDERGAFEQLRSHARNRSRTVVDTARAVCEGHGLLPKGPEA